MRDRIKLVLLYGGRSGEHEISLVSAASVLAHLDANRYEITPVGMDKQGRCFVNDYETLLRHKESLPVKTEHAKAIPSLLVNGCFFMEADVVFPMVHGPLYEDGCLQGLLGLANVAFVGSDVLSSAIGMDKDMTRRLVCNERIQAASYRVFTWTDNKEKQHDFAKKIANELGWPVFVKPCAMGSSVGIHKVDNHADLINALSDARRYDTVILVEAQVEGREIELAVLESAESATEPYVSNPGEIKINHRDGYYSYAAKYLDSDCTDLIVPATFANTEMVSRLQAIAREVFVGLKCKGMARVDFFVDESRDVIYLNEINTLPGFTPISMYPRLWEAEGIDYAQLLDRLIALAMMHYRNHNKLVRHYQ